MNLFLITYDLINNKDYSKLFKALETYDKWHFLESAWIVKTSSSMQEVFKVLDQCIDSDDKLIIVKIDGAIWSDTLPKEFSSWIQKDW